MFPFWLKIIFACSGIVGLFLLVKSVSKMISVYSNPNSVEFPATLAKTSFQIKEAGMYEIAVKRPALFGIIPTNISFRLIAIDNNTPVTVNRSLNLFSQRKNMSGERIVPIAEFKAEKNGEFQLENLDIEKFKERDKLLITPKTGTKGFFLIFAILFSAILFIGGTVLTVISLVKK
jgi:hypothetical protein